MTIEELKLLNESFEQLEKLQIYLKRYEEGDFKVRVEVRGYLIDNKVINKIVKKYTVNIIEDLKNEIKKRETELESISIVKLNKLV